MHRMVCIGNYIERNSDSKFTLYIIASINIYQITCMDNTVVSNHFHSVKNFLFSSAKPRDFDGMLGTGLPVSMYTTKTPINKCRFNVTQLKDFFLHFL